MTVENGPVEGANDTTVADQNASAPVADEQDDTAQDLTDEGDGQPVDETEELEWDGKKWVLPKDAVGTLKPALLRQADYTQKTQAVAKDREALAAEREQLKAEAEAQKTHFHAATKLAALDEQLQGYAKVDWQTLYNTNPDLYQQHRINYDTLKDQRDTAARDFSQKENERRQSEERESANRVQKAQAEIARHLPEWTPGGELDLKLAKYATDIGLPTKELGEFALRAPQLVKELNRLRLYDEAAAKQKTQQTFQQSQQAKPVPRVGGNGGSAARKTTDPSGDALSTDEWVKRERERLEKRKA